MSGCSLALLFSALEDQVQGSGCIPATTQSPSKKHIVHVSLLSLPLQEQNYVQQPKQWITHRVLIVMQTKWQKNREASWCGLGPGLTVLKRERVATTARCACMCLTGRMDSPETNQGSDALIRNQQGDIYNLNWSHTRVAVNQKEYSQSISLSWPMAMWHFNKLHSDEGSSRITVINGSVIKWHLQQRTLSRFDWERFKEHTRIQLSETSHAKSYCLLDNTQHQIPPMRQSVFCLLLHWPSIERKVETKQ